MTQGQPPRTLRALALTLCLAGAAAAEVFYVNHANTSGVEDGTSWATAFTTIQPAIDAAADAGDSEVWVVAGVYDEAREAASDSGSLVIHEGVSLYGGFDGSETSRSERDWEENLTIIDGAIARGGSPAYHVIIMGALSILDGAEIRGGHADGPSTQTQIGGGIYCPDGGSRVLNCVVRDNRAAFLGAGIFAAANLEVQNSDFQRNGSLEQPTGALVVGGFSSITDCFFRRNLGAAVVLQGSDSTLSDTEIVDNKTTTSGSVLLNGNRHALDRVVFANNETEAGDGGALSAGGSGHTLKNCLFINNSSQGLGGAIYFTGQFDGIGNLWNGGPIIVNCTFFGNQAMDGGGAIYARTADVTLHNSIVWGNGGASLEVSSGDAPSRIRATYSIVEGGYPGQGNLEGDPLFLGPTVGDLRIETSSPALDAGTNEPTPPDSRSRSVEIPDSDLEGTTRPQGAGIDMGAYEYFDGQPARYLLQVETDGMGDVTASPAPSLLDEGTEVTLTATPADGHAFAGWDGAVMTDTNPLTYTLTTDATLTALFRQQFALTLQTDGNGAVTPFEGTQTVLDGTTLTLEATGNDGYLFDRWVGDLPSEDAAFENPLTFTLASDTTLTATFIAAPYGCRMSARAGVESEVDWGIAIILLGAVGVLGCCWREARRPL